MRLVDADELIKKLDGAMDTNSLASMVIVNALITLIAKQPTVTDTNVGCNWIPVSERLPEENQKVLFAHIHGRDDVICGRYSDKTFIVDGTWYTTYEVLAWMPLPEPYE